MISAIDLLKEMRDLCDSLNGDCSNCPIFDGCRQSPDSFDDKTILSIVKFCRERKERRERK